MTDTTSTALSKAATAVRELTFDNPLFPYIHVEDAVAAIEALSDER